MSKARIVRWCFSVYHIAGFGEVHRLVATIDPNDEEDIFLAFQQLST
jgi:hypothetical protein